MRIDFHPDATADLDASAAWYAERSASAARNFLVAVDVAITSITQEPLRFYRVDERHQACRKMPGDTPLWRDTLGDRDVSHVATSLSSSIFACFGVSGQKSLGKNDGGRTIPGYQLWNFKSADYSAPIILPTSGAGERTIV